MSGEALTVRTVRRVLPVGIACVAVVRGSDVLVCVGSTVPDEVAEVAYRQTLAEVGAS